MWSSLTDNFVYTLSFWKFIISNISFSFSFWPRFPPRGGPDSWPADGPSLPFSSIFLRTPRPYGEARHFFRSRINHVLGSGNGTTVANSGEISCHRDAKRALLSFPRDSRLFISLFASNSDRYVTRIVRIRKRNRFILVRNVS